MHRHLFLWRTSREESPQLLSRAFCGDSLLRISPLGNNCFHQPVKHLEQLFGAEWVERVIRSADSQHPLALWHRKALDNPVARYADYLADFILNSGLLKCDSGRLGSKIKADFLATLGEMGYAVFLGEQGFHVTMEPFAPKAGPDLHAKRGEDYFVEIRRVGLDETRASADFATEAVFTRLCKLPSRFSIIISMTDAFGAYSPQLKRAMRRVQQVLKEIGERHLKTATLYHYESDYSDKLVEGEVAGPDFSCSDGQKLKAQIEEFKQIQKAPFVARFYDTGSENDHTTVAVHPLGSRPGPLQPDKTHLRLRDILHQKREQLPKAARGLIVLDLSELKKLGIGRDALIAALYCDMQMTIRVRTGSEQFDSEFGHRRNGFFGQTTRISAVVMEEIELGGDIQVAREVFPTNNAGALLLTRAELECFGSLNGDFHPLCK